MHTFISYSHKDSVKFEQLTDHLSVLRDEGEIIDWSDREIIAGEEFPQKIKEEMEKSKLILLLLSSNYFASDSCKSELKYAIKRHNDETAIVIPIILNPCDWNSNQDLKNLLALPNDAKPISQWEDIDAAYLNIVKEIRKVMNKNKTPSVKNIEHVSPFEQTTPTIIAEQSINQILRDFRRVGSYRQAESFAKKLIIPIAHQFSTQQVKKFLNVIESNRQIIDANETPQIVSEVFKKTKHLLSETNEFWQEFLNRQRQVSNSSEYTNVFYADLLEELSEWYEN